MPSADLQVRSVAAGTLPDPAAAGWPRSTAEKEDEDEHEDEWGGGDGDDNGPGEH